MRRSHLAVPEQRRRSASQPALCAGPPAAAAGSQLLHPAAATASDGLDYAADDADQVGMQHKLAFVVWLLGLGGALTSC